MLPTLAERLREQHAKTRGRRPSRSPWPVPGEPPTALLFQACAEVERPVLTAVPVDQAVPPASPMAEPEPLPPMSGAAVMAVARPELPEPELSEPPMALAEPAVSVAPLTLPERTALAELVLLLVWAVLVVIDGALALASLIDGAGGRPRRPPGSAASALSASAAPPLLMAAAAP